jgi:hypothetical protein
MSVISICAILGLFLGLLVGILSLVFPRNIAFLVGISAKTQEGVAEIRLVHGGFFLFLEIIAALLWFGQHIDLGIAMAGLVWIGAVLGRLLSRLLDAKQPENGAASMIFEAFVGFLHLAVWMQA